MIKPTIGRVVLYKAEGVQPCAALIAFVHDDETINIGGFDERGVHFNEQYVHLVQDPDQDACPGQAYWMPYQHGQAAKTESVIEQLDEALEKGDAEVITLPPESDHGLDVIECDDIAPPVLVGPVKPESEAKEIIESIAPMKKKKRKKVS